MRILLRASILDGSGAAEEFGAEEDVAGVDQHEGCGARADRDTTRTGLGDPWVVKGSKETVKRWAKLTQNQSWRRLVGERQQVMTIHPHDRDEEVTDPVTGCFWPQMSKRRPVDEAG